LITIDLVLSYRDIENFTNRRYFYCTISSNVSVRWADTDIVLLQLALPIVGEGDRRTAGVQWTAVPVRPTQQYCS
jgi:hypothetical protein